MPVVWNLRELLKQCGITRACHVSKIIHERTGYRLSTQAVCDLLNGEPKMIRLETAQAFCDAFYFRMSEFFEMMPAAARKPPEKRARRFETMNSPESQASGGESDLGEIPISSRNSKLDYASFFSEAGKLCARQSIGD
jgi:hypothetical protein